MTNGRHFGGKTSSHLEDQLLSMEIILKKRALYNKEDLYNNKDKEEGSSQRKTLGTRVYNKI